MLPPPGSSWRINRAPLMAVVVFCCVYSFWVQCQEKRKATDFQDFPFGGTPNSRRTW